MMFKFLRKILRKRKSITLVIEDCSKRGEVVYVHIGDERIAFPAHSTFAIRSLIFQINKRLGYEAINYRR